MTNLVIRHHGLDASAVAAILDAPWAASTGAEVVGSVLADGRPVPGALALVLVGDVSSDADADAVTDAVLAQAAAAPTLLLGRTVDVLPRLVEPAGVHPGRWTPAHEIRLRPAPGVDPRRLEDLLLDDTLLLPDKVGDDVRVLATANVGFADYPVVTFRAATGLGTLTIGGSDSTWADREALRFLRHVALSLADAAPTTDVGVGMLGYGAIGHEHALAVTAVPGLALAAVSDLNPARTDLARTVAADVRGYPDADALLADDDVDLVVVSTPPDTHADWARRALEQGKHVVLEKPMALTAAECDDVIARAVASDRLVVVYQNRRFDPDYLVLRRLVRAGTVGELFHTESFVGGYGHPCNYWHSDAAVSGGAIFDWGSHYIDQLLDLMPGPVAHVTAANHKRRWHDVTNADHSRVTVHFADGREAEFVHSDLAAAPKPKWLALGTHGAIRGDWRAERVVRRTAVGTLDEDVLALADSPARMSLHAPDGSVTSLAVPPAPRHAFHRELADHLLCGLPMSVDAGQSRRVVAVMDAAEQSAGNGAVPVSLP